MGKAVLAVMKAYGESQENHREAGLTAVTPTEHLLLKPLLPQFCIILRLTLKLGTVLIFWFCKEFTAPSQPPI